MSSAATSATTANNSSAGVTAITNQSQYNAAYTQFLSMLTTELQNQDPTSPMDASQFTDQLVGFSQLEQQLQTNSSLSTLVTDQGTSTFNTSLGYIGHTVLASGDTFSLAGAGASTNVTYSLATNAENATMTVTDSSGTKVASVNVPTAKGQNTFSFDGKDSDGDQLPAGQYAYSIAATDTNGNAVTATTYTAGVVSGVDSSSGSPVLQVGANTISPSDIVEVLN